MHRTYKLLLPFLFIVTTINAQDSLRVPEQDTTVINQFSAFYRHPFYNAPNRPFLQLKAGGWIDANAVNNSLLLKIYFKDDLNRQLIEENANRQQAKNVAGSDSRVEINYFAMNKPVLRRDSIHWYFGYGVRDFSGTTFSEDLFKLMGLGNSSMQGDTADGNNFRLVRTRYDYLKAGLLLQFSDKSNLSVHAGVTRGMKLVKVMGKRLSIYTAPYGAYLNCDVDLDVKANRKLRDDYSGFNGLGAFVGIEYNRLIGAGALSVGLNDLGFMSWLDGRQFRKDSSFRYDGAYISPFDANRPDAEAAYDSVQNMFTPQRKDATFSTGLPADFHIQYSFRIWKKSMIAIRADKTFFSAMLPLFSATYYYMGKGFYSASTLQAGGFGTFNVNQEFGFATGKHFLGVNLIGIEGMIAPAEFGGMGAGINYIWGF